MSSELKALLMREEAVRRENSANLERAKHQLADARELLRLQMIADMGAGGKTIVVDSNSPNAGPVLANQGVEPRRSRALDPVADTPRNETHRLSRPCAPIRSSQSKR